MDHTSLEIFHTVAAELSITRAAKRLGRVQSNVTTRIQQLEEELGVTLFQRDSKPLSLTSQGEQFLDYANRLLALAEEARQVLHPQAPIGILRVGSMESTAASRLPGPLASYHQQWPQVQLKISTAPSRQLMESVRNRLLDCALVALPVGTDGVPTFGEQELDEMGLHGQPVFREDLLLLLPANHRPIRHAGDVTLRSLAAFAQGCSYRAFAEDWLAGSSAAECSLDIQEVGSYHAMLACVASGGCISFMPRSVLELQREPTGVQTHVMAQIDTWLVWRHGYDTPAFSALREQLVSSAMAEEVSA